MVATRLLLKTITLAALIAAATATPAISEGSNSLTDKSLTGTGGKKDQTPAVGPAPVTGKKNNNAGDKKDNNAGDKKNQTPTVDTAPVTEKEDNNVGDKKDQTPAVDTAPVTDKKNNSTNDKKDNLQGPENKQNSNGKDDKPAKGPEDKQNSNGKDDKPAKGLDEKRSDNDKKSGDEDQRQDKPATGNDKVETGKKNHGKSSDCPSLEPTKTCKTLVNKDRQGADLTMVPGSAKSCDKACEDNFGCRTWSWSDYNGGTCWLKSTDSKLIDKQGVISTECLFNLSSKTCSLHLDIDLAGDDIGNTKAKDPSLCCDLCKGFDKCTAWSWSSYNTGTCWFKKNVGRTYANPGVVSSSIKKLEGAVCAFEYDVDFEGNDIGNKPAKKAAGCCSKCKANKECKAYTWTNYNGGTCWMKSGKGNIVSKPGAISSKLA